jgi:endonuclease YncB( thermonuclease family)
MARRKKHESTLVTIAILFLGAFALCCSGPLGFLVSPPARPRATGLPSSPESTTVLDLTPSKPASAPFAPTLDRSESFTFRTKPAPTPQFETEPANVVASSAAAGPAKAVPINADLFREWTDDSGGFRVVAIVARFDENEAKLQREDGKLVTVPLTRLSQADRAYLTEVRFPPTYLPGGKVALGKAVGVTDGDTIKLVDDDKGNYTIRLEGIDAPESHQAFGTQAKKALSDKVFGKVVRVEWKETDKYGRTLGHVYFGRHHINLELLEEGMAWHYKKYSTDQVLATAEVKAKELKLGLWRQPNPTAPWDFRSGGENQVAAAPFSETRARQPTPSQDQPVSLTVYVTKTGDKYHLGGCRHLSKSRIAISLDRAKAGYSRCSVCKPP